MVHIILHIQVNSSRCKAAPSPPQLSQQKLLILDFFFFSSKMFKCQNIQFNTDYSIHYLVLLYGPEATHNQRFTGCMQLGLSVFFKLVHAQLSILLR